jgi:Lipopolysaccharide-assembly
MLLSLAAAGALAGCAGYRVGPTGDQTAGGKSVQVVPFLNRTPEPRLADAVTAAVRKELQRDGTLLLATHDAGDIIVTGALTRYVRHEVSLVPEDVATVRDYNLGLTAQVTARDRGTGKVLFDQPITSYTLIRVSDNLSNTERQALPLLATDLARRITALLADGSW